MRVAAGVGIERLRVQMISKGEHHVKRPETLIPFPALGHGRRRGTSQIGYSHRCAALRDNVYTLLAGALDVDAERGRAFGEQLGIAPERCYADYQTLFREEAQRPDGIEVVSVTTPNNTHFAITKAALEAGLHVICEKPLCFTAEEARELVDLSKNRTKSSASPTAMPAIR